MEILPTLIFIVVIIASLAQKFQETRANNEAKRAAKNKSKPGELSDAARRQMFEGAPTERVAKPRGKVVKKTVSPETTGRELIDALFGDGASKSDEGWTDVPVPPPIRKELPKRVQQVPRTAQAGHSRDAAVQQREQMERERGSSRQASRDEANRHGVAEEQRRLQVLAERECHKQKIEAQRRKAAAGRTSAAARARGVVAPASNRDFVPRSLGDARRAIVMAEILGKPKAFQ